MYVQHGESHDDDALCGGCRQFYYQDTKRTKKVGSAVTNRAAINGITTVVLLNLDEMSDLSKFWTFPDCEDC